MSIAQAALDHGTAAPVTPETAPAQATIEVSSDPRMEVFAKMERKVKQREAELAAKMKEIEEKEQRYGKYANAEGRVKENPLAALRELGFDGDLETLNKWALENLSDEELDPVAKRFKQVEQTLADKEREFEEKIKKAIEEKEKEYQTRDQEFQIKQFKSEIKNFLDQGKDQFELLYSQPEAQELVYELVYEDVLRQQKEGKEQITPMDLKVAAEKLENYLDAQLEPLLKSKKIQSKFQKPESWLDAYQSKATLTNEMTPSSAPSASELTPAERAELAIRKLKEGKYPIE